MPRFKLTDTEVSLNAELANGDISQAQYIKAMADISDRTDEFPSPYSDLDFKTNDAPIEVKVIDERERTMIKVLAIRIDVPFEKLALIQSVLYAIAISTKEDLQLKEEQLNDLKKVTNILCESFKVIDGKSLYHALVSVRKTLQTSTYTGEPEQVAGQMKVIDQVCEHLSELIATVLKGFVGW